MKGTAFLFINRFVTVILCITLSGCTKGSTEDMEKGDSSEMETDGPEITILNKPGVIEVVTDLDISITDDTNTSTRVLVNGTEVMESAEKEFKLTIDPFDYNIGNASVKIISINDLDQENFKDFSIEIKRLLFSDKSFFYKKNNTQGQRFISIHTSGGDLIELQKIDDPQDGNFYAPEDFDKQNLIVTRYEIPGQISNFSSVQSYMDVAIGTVVTLDQTPNDPEFLPKTGQFNFKTEDIDDLVATNYNSSLFKDNTDNSTSYQLIYSQEYNEKFFISTSPEIIDPIENYKYFFITDISKSAYSKEDLKYPIRISTVDLPVDSDFRLNLFGFEDEQAFNDQRFNEIYVSRSSSLGKVEVPIIEEFDVYQARLAYSYDRTDVLINQKDVESPIEQLKVDMIQSGRNIEFIDNYDYLSFGLTNVSQPNSVIWSFISKYKSEMTVPFYTFEIPPEITSILAANSLNLDINTTSSESSFLECTLYKGHDHIYNSEQLIVEPNFSSNRDGFVFTRRLDIL